MEDYKKWIEDIVVEIAEISVMKAAFKKMHKLISAEKNNFFLIELSHKNFYYAYITRLIRIIEPLRGRYLDDDYSLPVLLSKYSVSQNPDAAADIQLLKTLHGNMEEFRNKEIAHFTRSKSSLIWQTSDDTLLKVQELTNKYLNIITGHIIKDWDILLNNEMFTWSPYTSIQYNNGTWTCGLTLSE